MSEPEVHYYCLEELAESAKILQAIREQLPVIHAQYRQHRGTGQRQEIEALVDMQAAVRRLWGEFPGLVQRLCEYGDDELLKTARKLYEALRRYDYLGASDLTPLCRALEAFEQMLPTPGRNINAAALGRLMNRVRMGYQPTDPAHVDLLRRAVTFPTEPVNLLDPCCGEGEALARFADGANAVTYGIEIDELRGEMAQRRLNRVGFGSFFFSRVSSGAFQGLFLNPPYLSVRTEYGNRRLEKSFLADGLRLLQNGGLLVYIIPYYRATPDVCRVLCENLNDLRVHRFMGQEFRQFRQVVFLGTKSPAGKPPEWQNACLPTCSPRKTYRSWISFRKAPMSFRRRLSRWNSLKAINSMSPNWPNSSSDPNPSTACLKTVLSTIGNGGRFCR